MAQAYLEYLVALHPVLATSFSRILSAGIAASKPGVPLSAGVEFMLRDYGISSKFSHISRRLERRDVEKFEYVLTMSCSQRDTILSRWTPRSNLPVLESGIPGEVCREETKWPSLAASEAMVIGKSPLPKASTRYTGFMLVQNAFILVTINASTKSKLT